MKKSFLLLAAVCCLSLAACGGGDKVKGEGPSEKVSEIDTTMTAPKAGIAAPVEQIPAEAVEAATEVKPEATAPEAAKAEAPAEKK